MHISTSLDYPAVKEMIVRSLVLSQSERVTDRQTDGRTDTLPIATSSCSVALLSALSGPLQLSVTKIVVYVNRLNVNK